MIRSKLSRRKEHREALIINLAKSLIIYEQIQSTITKVKVLRPFVEKLITRAKEENLQNRRHLLSCLRNDEYVVNKLFKIGALHKNRNGGYTRIVRVGERNGITKGIISIIQDAI